MKKTILFFSLFSVIFIFSQKNEKYLAICYSSICCGTPSGKPVADYLKKFKEKNHVKYLEIWKESGLGKEGEYCLYVGIDNLNKIKNRNFLIGLKKAVSQQNLRREANSSGSVNIDEKMTTKKELIMKQQNPTNGMSTLKIYKI